MLLPSCIIFKKLASPATWEEAMKESLNAGTFSEECHGSFGSEENYNTRIVIVVAPNASGKSLYLERLQSKKQFVLCRPARPLTKYAPKSKYADHPIAEYLDEEEMRMALQLYHPGKQKQKQLLPLEGQASNSAPELKNHRKKACTIFSDCCSFGTTKWELNFRGAVEDAPKNPTHQPEDITFSRTDTVDGETRSWTFRWTDVSDGLRQAFRMILYGQYSMVKGKVLILDEPESHLHPRLYLRLICGLLVTYSNLHLLIATHDIALVSAVLHERYSTTILELSSTIRSEASSQQFMTAYKKLHQSSAGKASIPATSSAAGSPCNDTKGSISAVTLVSVCLKKVCSYNNSESTVWDTPQLSPSMWSSLTGKCSTIVFVEGFFDQEVLEWVYPPEDGVQFVSVAGWKAVIDSLAIFSLPSSSSTMAAVISLFSCVNRHFGVIDRDRRTYLSDGALELFSLPNLRVLNYAELENVFWHPKVLPLYTARDGKSIESFWQDVREQISANRESLWFDFYRDYLYDRLLVIGGKASDFQLRPKNVAQLLPQLTEVRNLEDRIRNLASKSDLKEFSLSSGCDIKELDSVLKMLLKPDSSSEADICRILNDKTVFIDLLDRHFILRGEGGQCKTITDSRDVFAEIKKLPAASMLKERLKDVLSLQF